MLGRLNQTPRKRILTIGALLLLLASSGCTRPAADNPRPEHRSDEAVREQSEKATERLKPGVQWIARNLGYAAARAADLVISALEGIWEGWQANRNPGVDLNSASESELARLPGITQREAIRIIQGRPYKDKHQLVTMGILSEAGYQKIRDEITVR